jgi:hypothetical protein
MKLKAWEKGDELAKVIVGVIVVTMIIGVTLGMIFLLWLLWTWVMPQLWQTGPGNFIKPNYWLFTGAWILFGTLLKVIRGGK